MELLSAAIRDQLLKNGREQETVRGTEQERDFVPVVKLFDPCGAATWLITEMDPEDNDRLFGLCDLEMSYPELGWVSLTELQSVRNHHGLGIERDLHFKADKPLSAYTTEAIATGGIVA